MNKNNEILSTNDGYIKKINKSLLMEGILDLLLFKLLNNTVTDNQLYSF